MKWLLGIDEAGRGPLAGPVAVGVAAVRHDFDWSLLPGVDDSKKLSESRRERIYKQALALRKAGTLDFAVAQTSANMIDRWGIVKAVEIGMARGLKRLELNPNECEVRLDGSLRAPSIYVQQTTIIGGDSLEPAISLASILAKVTRDRYMIRVAKKPKYNFYDLSVHKGYGTKKHCELIVKHGLSDIHRRSFCRNIHRKKDVVF